MNNYQKWLELGLSKGLSDIQIKIAYNRSLRLSVYDGQVEQNEISQNSKARIKGIYNGKAANISFEDLNDDNVNLMFDKLIDSAKNITASEPALIFEGSKKYQKVDETVFDFTTINPKDKVDLLLKIEEELKKEPMVQKVATVDYNESENQVVIINSKGLNLRRHNSYAAIFAYAVYFKEGQTKSSLSYQIIKDFKNIDYQKIVSDNIKKGLGQLGAEPVNSSQYPVVFDQEEFGNIISAYWSIFTGEANYRNLTKLTNKENTQIANTNFNLVDDPFNEEALFKTAFDDEGVACQKRYIIKDGIFTNFAHNLKTAAIYNTNPTGNGFGSGIVPTNLVVETENISFDEMLNTIEKGIYINGLVGLHAGIEEVSGNFSLQASGFLIEKGQLTKPVDMIVVSGNFFELLNNIEHISNDFMFGLSGVGTGSVKIKQLTIAGK